MRLTMAIMLILAPTASVAGANPEETEVKALGEQLLHQVWTGMKKTDMEAIDTLLASGFQAVHQNGAQNREQEMALIKGLKLGDYTLNNIAITRNGPLIVATYFVTVAETIDGERLQKKPAARLSVFLKTEGGWQWMAHANLNPLQ